MTLKIIHKNNTSAGQAPASGDIDVGEVAINAADAELYVKDTGGNIKKFANTDTTGTAAGVQFTQAGTGAVQRTVESKLQDVVSVKDFGAVGDGVADDTSAIQAAITAAEPYGKRHVYFSAGNYKTTSPILVQQPITLEGAGSSITSIFANHNGDGIVFQPSDAGTANSYLNGGQILHLGVSRNNAGNGGSAVWLRQCSGFKAFDVRAHNHDYGIRISGGQLNTLDTIRTYCFSPYTGGPVGASAGIRLEQADIGSGNYQKCYTVQISNWIATSGFSKLHSYALSASMADGLTINGAYLAYYASSHFQFKREITSDYVTAVSVSDVYFDGVESTPSGTGGTPRAIYIAPSLTGGNTLRSIRVSNCMLANCRGGQSIVDVREFVDGLGFSNCVFAGCDSVAVNIGPATSAGVNEGHYTFVGNYFRNVLNGIKITDVDSITISSNTFTDLTGSVGIQFNGLADKVKLTSNTFSPAISFPVSNLATASASDLIDLRQEYTGSYTPTATAVANLDNVTISELSYIRINDVVNVFGKIGINPTASGTVTRFLLSLPFTANFTATGAAGGTLHSYTTGSASVGGCITADTVSDQVEFNLVPTVTYELSYWFTFSYVIS